VTARRDELCTLLQEIGFPAVRIKPVSAEVVGSNELFSSLVNASAALESRVSFVEGVLPRVATADRASWEAALANQTPVAIHVGFKAANGRGLDFEMRSFPSLSQTKRGQSTLCVFIPLTTPTFERMCDARLSDGRELEKARIRNELHKGVSQQLLGAAFGCKVLAGKVATLSENLGKEASDLAQLVNEAVIELQNLVQSNQNKS